MKLRHFLSIAAMAGIIISCSKGDTGAAGPQGLTGAQGAKGDTGATGATGAPGNSNVKGQTFVTTTASWGYNSPNWNTTFMVAALDTNVLRHGVVDVYMSLNAGDNWTAWPFVLYGTVSDYLATFVTGLTSVQIDWAYNSAISSGSDPNTFYGASTIKWNVVCIAPAMIQNHPGTNWKNPSEVELLPEVQAALHNNK